MVHTIESIILKAKYGSDIRKSQLCHSQDLNFNDLMMMMHRTFQLHTSMNLLLKYRDNEGDWITMANDNDVLFAIRNEPYLYIEVFLEEGSNLLQRDTPLRVDSASNLQSKDESVSTTERVLQTPPTLQQLKQFNKFSSGYQQRKLQPSSFQPQAQTHLEQPSLQSPPPAQQNPQPHLQQFNYGGGYSADQQYQNTAQQHQNQAQQQAPLPSFHQQAPRALGQQLNGLGGVYANQQPQAPQQQQAQSHLEQPSLQSPLPAQQNQQPYLKQFNSGGGYSADQQYQNPAQQQAPPPSFHQQALPALGQQYYGQQQQMPSMPGPPPSVSSVVGSANPFARGLPNRRL